MPKQPTPDEYGRLRVLDVDTGHEQTIHASALPHGNYEVLSKLASHPQSGEALPPVHKSLSGPTTAAKQADSKKETDDA